jgi:hypothetical protein
MTMMDTLSTLLGTIPGLTVNQPKSPRAAAVKTLPAVEIIPIASDNVSFVNGTNVYYKERVQINMAASTYANLETLLAQVRVKLDNNHTNFILSYPLGRGPTGYDDNPPTHWTSADWLILY